MSERFALHYGLLVQYLRGADALLAHAVANEAAFHVGVRAQWAALSRLALTEADLLAAIASSETELAWAASFEPRRGELLLAYEAHEEALGQASQALFRVVP